MRALLGHDAILGIRSRAGHLAPVTTTTTSLASLLSTLLFASTLGAQEQERDFQPKRVVGAFRAITGARISKPDNMRHQVAESDLVLGLVVGKQARAYPINMLTGPQREIINDELGGRAIAATW